MLKRDKIICTVILIVACFIMLFFFIKGALYPQTMVWFCSQINGIFLMLSLLILVDFHYKTGAILASVSYVVYMVIIILFSPEKVMSMVTLVKSFVEGWVVYPWIRYAWTRSRSKQGKDD